MSEPPTLPRGQRVLMRFGNDVAPGVVCFTSGNGYAIAVEFDGLLGGFVNVLPLLWDEDAGTFRTFMTQPVGVEPVAGGLQ